MIWITSIGIGLLSAANAHAYIDPGTGSMALQMLIGGVLAALFAVKTYWYRFKQWLLRLRGKDTP